MKLQCGSGIILLNVCILFNHLIDNYGLYFQHHLAADATIISNPSFKKAIVRQLKGGGLSSSELEEIERFLVRHVPMEESVNGINLMQVQQLLYKQQWANLVIQYIELEEVLPTTCVVEQASLVAT